MAPLLRQTSWFPKGNALWWGFGGVAPEAQDTVILACYAPYQKWSETYVSGNADGVSSRSVDRGEFWVLREDGTQSQITKNYPVAAGHEVTVLWGNAAGKPSGDYFVLRNYTSNTTQYSIAETAAEVPIWKAYAKKA
ncbi:hypothetical protein K6L44_02655 [Gluconacetobacter entanii]|uniref:hypothetical protein n=1 Tax=Gluconacetobacter entanii TaxID=108528 RepID=UPI001C936D9C|nr:hypothetical protein [Gluconacetobacter entanii]MBY4638919.1 hypothetical protein [Gluconacetobacter entanii]MCW4579591.1 hypothetical protein [Gluconacetobacter entanii]MCW4582997.1 hypothetical protein [Gluconacetobacter entanii]MCW4586373.1 hypothetical protein [Gluconacetobacter entanii]